jgi:hypothetical protein
MQLLVCRFKVQYSEPADETVGLRRVCLRDANCGSFQRVCTGPATAKGLTISLTAMLSRLAGEFVN